MKMTTEEYVSWRDHQDRSARLAEAMWKSELSANEYRELVGQSADQPAEMSAAEYVAMMNRVKAPTAQGPASHTSTAKETFAEWLALQGIRDLDTEVRGIPGRDFRFDWASPELMLAIEYDGVADHATRRGSERDAEKGNLAQLHGWLFIRVNARSIRNGSAQSVVSEAIKVQSSKYL